jgi:hypothetical protein
MPERARSIDGAARASMIVHAEAAVAVGRLTALRARTA